MRILIVNLIVQERIYDVSKSVCKLTRIVSTGLPHCAARYSRNNVSHEVEDSRICVIIAKIDGGMPRELIGKEMCKLK